METIRLVTVGDFPPARLSLLARRLRGLQKRPVELVPGVFSPARAFDPQRRQYRSDLLLAMLAKDSDQESKILGVTDVDLFIPVLTFVFGEAQLSGHAAIVSSRRLRNEAYGMEPDESSLDDRLLKEAMHELGHTFGLLHCYNPQCVMQTSTYAELIDLKPPTFCASCEALVQTQTNVL